MVDTILKGTFRPDGTSDSALRGEGVRKRAASILLGRVATAHDVAELIAFLASNGAEYVTGQAINLGGARRCTERDRSGGQVERSKSFTSLPEPRCIFPTLSALQTRDELCLWVQSGEARCRCSSILPFVFNTLR